MGVGRGGKDGHSHSPGFSHMTVNVFFNKLSFCENIPTLTYHFFAALVNVKRQESLKPSGELGTKFFRTKMGYNFLKRYKAFFRKWIFSKNKFFTFYAGFLMQHSLEVSLLGACPMRPVTRH